MQRPFNPPPMPLLPSLFRSSSAPRAGADMPWRRQDFTAHSLGSEEQIVSVLGGVPQRFPGFAVDFAHDCKTFRPLDEHIAEHADKHAWGALETEALRSWLPRMIEAGLLVSAEDVHRRCAVATVPAQVMQPIGALGFPTGRGSRRSFGACRGELRGTMCANMDAVRIFW